MLTSGVVAKRTIKKFLKNSPNGPVWWYAGKKDLQQGVVWRLFFLVPFKVWQVITRVDISPRTLVSTMCKPCKQVFFGALVLPKKGGQDVRIHQLCTANETLRCDPVSLMWKCSCLDSSLKNINQNEFHLPQFSGWKWKNNNLKPPPSLLLFPNSWPGFPLHAVRASRQDRQNHCLRNLPPASHWHCQGSWEPQ